MAQSKSLQGQMDMLHGPLIKNIFLFALPLAASSILQQLFNSADTAVAGRFAGPEALAAVGGNGPILTLLINLFVGISVGANVVIANYIGQKKTDRVNGVVHTTIALALICGFMLMALGQIIARPLLILISTPSNVLDQAVLYLRILFLGMPFFMLYNFGSSILRSIGDTRKPLYALIAAGSVNVCLNLVFVIVFHLDVAGVGIATVISDGISSTIIIRSLIRGNELFQLNMRKLSLKKEYVIPIIKIGIPAGLQGVVFSFSNVCVQSAINSFGANAVAGSAAATNFEYFTYFMTSAFAQAGTTFTSQNFGAGDVKRCKQIFRIAMISAFCCSGLMCAVFVIGRGFFIQFFTVDPEAIHYALIRIIEVEMLEFVPVTYEIGAGILRGMGKSLLPSLETIIGTCLLRIIWVYAFFPNHRSFGMLLNVYPLSWFITGAMILISYFALRNRLFKKGFRLA